VVDSHVARRVDGCGCGGGAVLSHAVESMALKRATRPQLAELVQLLVEKVQANDREVDPKSIEWTPAARPFFEPAALPWRPRTDSNRRRAP
jgi:hypothetical protein